MKKSFILGLMLAFITTGWSFAGADTLYVDDDYDGDTEGWGLTAFAHPQDAVNAAAEGDIVEVYPGTYYSRQFTSPTPPHWTAPNDQWAPALIVYKAGLTIEAVDIDPANTIIKSDHDVWSNPVAVQASTGGVWDDSQYNDAGAYGNASPNGIIVIADNVTIDGFTVISTYGGATSSPSDNPNTAGILIGGLHAGDSDYYGISGATVRNCVVRGHSGIRLWKAPDTTLEGNTIDNNVPVASPGTTPLGAGIMVWDGWCDNPDYPDGVGWCEGPNVGTSGLQIIGNNITSYFGVQGIALGGYYLDDSDATMDHSNLFIHDNWINSTGHGVTFWGSGGENKFMTCINTVTVPSGYDEVAVWWGTYDGPYGINCDDQFVTGGGWIDSPASAMSVPASISLVGPLSDASWGGDYTRDTAAICSPNESPITFTGSADLSNLTDNGALLIGILDKKWIDDGNHGFFSGAYAYFGRRGTNLRIGPSDGNAGGGELNQVGVNLTFDPWQDVTVNFTMEIYDGSITVTYENNDYIDTYGDVPADLTWDEFEYGAYPGVDLWSPSGGVDYNVALNGCSAGVTGKANFAFISKYKKGATVPSGQTVFIFKAGDLNFHSDSYDWLVVTGSDYARFKGKGTINGLMAPNGEYYKFMIWAEDSDPDTFRIKIWWEENCTENVVYDNGMDQEIGGGSIVVHTSKK
jgi:hypothetical protein